MTYQLQILNDETDFCVFRPDKETLISLIVFAKEHSEKLLVQDDNASNVYLLASAIQDFMENPWKYSNAPKCVSCNRALTMLERYGNTTGKCGSCAGKDAKSEEIVPSPTPG